MNKTLKKRKFRFEAIIFSGIIAFCAVFSFSLKTMEAITTEAAPLWPEEPEIKAFSAVLMEASTGSIIYDYRSKTQSYPASTTKLLTTLLVLEQKQLTDIVTMSSDAVMQMANGASGIYVGYGESFTVEEGLYATLLPSANEVCYALAENMADGDINRFIDMMNEKAKELGLVNSHFMNPHGLHDINHYSCAYDLALILRKLLKYPSFSRIAYNYNHAFLSTDLAGGQKERWVSQTHWIIENNSKKDNVNKLKNPPQYDKNKIYEAETVVGKTGHTNEAGYCLVTAAERKEMTLIAVVLGEENQADAYEDTKKLFDYGFEEFELSSAQSDDEMRNAFPVLFADEDAFSHKVKSDLSISRTMLVLPKGAKFSDVTNKCTLYPIITMEAGKNIIGLALYYYGDREVGRADVIYTSEVKQVVDPAALYLQEYRYTDEFDEEVYQELAGFGFVEDPPPEDIRPLIIGYIVAILALVFGLFIFVNIYNKRFGRGRRRR